MPNELVTDEAVRAGIAGIMGGLAIADNEKSRAYFVSVQQQLLACRDALRGTMSIAFAFGPKDGRTKQAKRLRGHAHIAQARASLPEYHA